MPKLDATRTYANNQSPVQADFDNFIDDIEILLNTTKLDDDNFQTGGITGSTKLIDGSVSTSNIRNNNITTAKIADNAVTSDKLAAGAVTTAKLAANAVTEAKCFNDVGEFPTGATIMLHTYNSTTTVPRGWMVLNGDIVNETNYEAIHGVGTYATDGIAASEIINKNLPDMTDKYPVGASATTQDGSSAITSVGNSGNTVNISHNHTYSHTHELPVARITLASGAPESDFYAYYESAGLGPTLNDFTTDATDPGTSTQLSSSQDIKPESIEMMFIMKVI